MAMGGLGATMAPPPRQWRDMPFRDPSAEQHWEQSSSLDHHLLQKPELEPNLEHGLRFQQKWRHDIVRIRAEVMRETNDLVDDFEESTTLWMSDPDPLPKTARLRYQVPLLLHFLEPFDYPDMAGISSGTSTTDSSCWANFGHAGVDAQDRPAILHAQVDRTVA